jgi:hypothetical protein
MFANKRNCTGKIGIVQRRHGDEELIAQTFKVRHTGRSIRQL